MTICSPNSAIAKHKFDSEKDFVIFLSQEGLIESWNPVAEKFLGYSAQDIVGRPFTILLSEDRVPEFSEKIRQFLSDATKDNFSGSFINKYGRRIDFWINLKLLDRAEGTSPGIVLNCREIVTSKITPMGFSKVPGEIHPMIGKMTESQVFYTTNLEGKILSWTRGAETVNGYSSSDAVGMRLESLYPDDELQKGYPKKELDLALEHGIFIRDGWRIRKDGSRFWAQAVTTVLRDLDGKAIGFSRLVRDISNTLRARQYYHDKEDAFRRIIENSQDLISITSPRASILYVSPSLSGLLGYEPNEVVGKSVLSYLHIGDVPDVMAAVKQSIVSPKIPIPIEFRVCHAKGSWHIFRGTIVNLLHDRQIAGLLLNARDITLEKKLEDRVIRVGEEERKRLASDLHDGLVQELAGIEFLARVLESKLDKKNMPESKEAARLGDLLKKSIFSTRDLSHQIYPQGLQEGLGKAVTVFAEDIMRMFSVDIEVMGLESLPIRNMEAESHCFNIIREATKNALNHGEAKKIVISGGVNDGRMWLSIRDNGTFGKKRSNEKNEQGGIGQRLMQHRARMLDGSLDFHQNLTGGMTVIFKFPFPKDAAKLKTKI